MPGRSRRSLLQGAAAAGSTALAGCDLRSADPFGGSPAADGPAEWPMRHRDAANTAAAPDGRGPRHLSDVEELLSVSDSMLFEQPVVAEDVVYATFDRTYAVEAAGGDRRWTGGSVFPPAVGDDAVFLADNPVNARAKADGAVRWRLEDSTGNSAPTVGGGTVYVGADGRYLYALDATTGHVRWRFEAGDVVNAAPAVDDDTVYAGSDDGTLYALDRADGTVRWRYAAGDEVNDPPVVVGDLVLVTADGRLTALDASDGGEYWHHDPEAKVLPPAVAGSDVYATDLDDTVRALEQSDGREQWATGVAATSASAPVVAGDDLYVAGRSLYRLDRRTGERRTALDRRGTPADRPAVAGGDLFAAYTWREYRYLYAIRDG